MQIISNHYVYILLNSILN